jgi:hypothetical protein
MAYASAESRLAILSVVPITIVTGPAGVADASGASVETTSVGGTAVGGSTVGATVAAGPQAVSIRVATITSVIKKNKRLSLILPPLLELINGDAN